MTKTRLLLLACAVLLATLNTGQAQVRITEVNLSTRNVELTNFGSTTVSFGTTWQWCRRRNYSAVSAAGESIAAGESKQFTISNLNQTSSDLGLYIGSSFGDPASMQDFVQWGGSFVSTGREGQAVTKEIWSSGFFITVPASGLSFHAKAQPPATGLRTTNWFTGRPHVGFPVPAPVFESFAITGGEWRIIANSYYLATALKTEANSNLSTAWQLQTPTVIDLGSGRFDIRFPASGARQFVRIRAAP